MFSCSAAFAAPRFVDGAEAVKYAEGLNRHAAEMKKAVLDSRSVYPKSDCTIYVAANGNDANDGRSQGKPIATLTKLNSLSLEPGSVVLFRRGDLFRGRINARRGVTYSAYGTGAKPVLCGSSRDWADPALWRATDIPCVWACVQPLSNVGVITFDHEPGSARELGRYDVVTARMVHSRKGVVSPAQLNGDLQFWSDLEKKILYLRSDSGNPGGRFRHIEIGEGGHGITVRGEKDVTVDNLHLTLFGCHGVSSGTVSNLEVRNCVFDWIGGSLLIPEGKKGGPCRFGNAVEVYGGCDGYRVHDCWMYQIYDTGITHQCHHANGQRIFQKNVEYARNLIEYCFWSIEYYNAFNGYGETRNVYVHHNFCRLGGEGWGCPGRAGGTPMFSIDDRPDVTSNYVNEANILQHSRGILVNNFGRHAPEMRFRGNIYAQPRGWNFANIGDLNRDGKCFRFDESAPEVMKEAFGETDGTYVFIPDPDLVEVKSASMKVAFSRLNGDVRQIIGADGTVFAANGGTELFQVVLMENANHMNGNALNARQAKKVSCDRLPNGLRFTFSDFPGKLEKAVCTITAAPGDAKLRWRIALEPKEGWAVQQTAYPLMTLDPKIGADAADDAFVGGHAKGGVRRNPGAGSVFWGRQPGSLVAQFGCWYDDHALFYYASEDGRGEVKDLSVNRLKDGRMSFSWRRYGWDDKPVDGPYDVVTACMAGSEERPCVWQDAADLYRSWAVKQRWCGKPLRDRDDLPKWMRDAPAMCRFHRHDMLDPDGIRAWTENHWLKNFPKAPLVMAYWGWEHRATWCSDYFPCVPSDDAFTALNRHLMSLNVHAFPWPSGYHWTLMYGERPDGTFEYDDRAHFNSVAAPHAVWNRDGKIYDRLPGWLNGGHVACMCPGDDWTINWWNRDVSLALAKRGCELVQADQVVGGAFPECWATNHPHLPGNGLWKTERFRHQLRTMRETMRTVLPDAVVCFEEPEELFNDLVGIQDYRDCEYMGEWASVWNYIYHEFVPAFQSNPRRGDRFWQAHCCADGQIPFLMPSIAEGVQGGAALRNGDFELFAPDAKTFVGWEEHAATHNIDTEVKHSGRSSLRMETELTTNHIQIAQNVPPAELDHTPGLVYRISAWLKTEKKGTLTSLYYGVYGPGLKGYVSGGMNFPAPGSDWTYVQSEFKLPPQKDANMLRIMINAGGGSTRVWIDDMKLEVVSPDGKARPATLDTVNTDYFRFMRAWVDLYHNYGRDWLAHGRQIRSPRLDCEKVTTMMASTTGNTKKEISFPAVMHQAYESLDGRRAVVLVNATDREQACTLHGAKGRAMSLTLKPDEIRLLK